MFLDVVSQVDEPKPTLSQNAQLPYHVAMDPCADHTAMMAAWIAAHEEPEAQEQVAALVNQLETNDLSRFVNTGQASIRDTIDAKLERQVADRLYDLIATAVKETFMNAVQPATDSVGFSKKIDT